MLKVGGAFSVQATGLEKTIEKPPSGCRTRFARMAALVLFEMLSTLNPSAGMDVPLVVALAIVATSPQYELAPLSLGVEALVSMSTSADEEASTLLIGFVEDACSTFIFLVLTSLVRFVVARVVSK